MRPARANRMARRAARGRGCDGKASHPASGRLAILTLPPGFESVDELTCFSPDGKYAAVSADNCVVVRHLLRERLEHRYGTEIALSAGQSFAPDDIALGGG